MSVKRNKFHYTFTETFNIATIYEDDRTICTDMLIEENTLDKVIDKLNELDIENNYLKIHKDKFERKYLETMLENKSLKKDMKNKKELISNLESKVIRQKGQLRNLNKSKFKIIFDFCDWLGGQGLAYETLYYGSEEDIVKLINIYLKEEGD